jgi:hypothetical protein
MRLLGVRTPKPNELGKGLIDKQTNGSLHVFYGALGSALGIKTLGKNVSACLLPQSQP